MYILGTPQFCGGISNHNDTYYCPTNYYAMVDDDIDKLSESTSETLTSVSSNGKKRNKSVNICLYFNR